MPIVHYTQKEAFDLAIKTAKAYRNLLSYAKEIIDSSERNTKLPQYLETKFRNAQDSFYALPRELITELMEQDLPGASTISLAKIAQRKLNHGKQ